MVMGADHLPLMTSRGGRDGGAAAATAAAAAEPLPHTTLSSWKDKTLKTGVALLELLRAVAPECVDAEEILDGATAIECKLNATYLHAVESLGYAFYYSLPRAKMLRANRASSAPLMTAEQVAEAVEELALIVSCHDIAGIWVAFFSRCQRYRC